MQPSSVRTPLISYSRDFAPAFRTARSSLMQYEFLWRLCRLFVLGPPLAALFNSLIAHGGSPIIANERIAKFFLSPLGVITLVAYAIIAMSLLLIEQAGLFGIISRANEGLATRLRDAMWLCVTTSGRMINIAICLVQRIMLLFLPLVAIAGMAYWYFLGGADINYFLTAKPPSFWAAVGIGAIVSVIGVILALNCLLRWLFVVPVALCQDASGWKALKESEFCSEGHRGATLGVIALWLLVRTLVTALFLFAIHRLSGLALDWAEGSVLKVTSVVATLLFVNILAVGIASAFDAVFMGILIHGLYRSLKPQTRQPIVGLQPAGSRSAIFALRLLMLVSLGATAAGIAISFAHDPAVVVSAHRSGPGKAPENSVIALKTGAIAHKADYSELDVQETADGVVVVLHDSDFRRVAGVPKSVWELTLAEIKQQVDIGSPRGPEFAGERIPTLQEFIDTARGNIKLNIELKANGHEKALPEKVVELIHKNDFTNQCVITSLDALLLARVRKLDPKIRIGMILSAEFGDLSKLDVDFLSLHQPLLTPAVRELANRRGWSIAVWTPDDRTSIEDALIRGADNIITNEPALAREVVNQFNQQSDAERILQRFRMWLKRKRLILPS